MFDKIDKKKEAIKTQNETINGIEKKKRGRPRKTNIKKVMFHLDEVLNAKLTQYCIKEHTPKSTFINQLLAGYFDELEKIEEKFNSILKA